MPLPPHPKHTPSSSLRIIVMFTMTLMQAAGKKTITQSQKHQAQMTNQKKKKDHNTKNLTVHPSHTCFFFFSDHASHFYLTPSVHARVSLETIVIYRHCFIVTLRYNIRNSSQHRVYKKKKVYKYVLQHPSL